MANLLWSIFIFPIHLAVAKPWLLEFSGIFTKIYMGSEIQVSLWQLLFMFYLNFMLYMLYVKIHVFSIPEYLHFCNEKNIQSILGQTIPITYCDYDHTLTSFCIYYLELYDRFVFAYLNVPLKGCRFQEQKNIQSSAPGLLHDSLTKYFFKQYHKARSFNY